MKKSILNLGKALNKLEQKQINGGKKYCSSVQECPENNCCWNHACLPSTHFYCKRITLG